jgi:hypothetical protein
MNKVSIEITSEGWKITLDINGEKIVEEYEITEGVRGVGGDIEDSDLVSDELYEALNNYFLFDIMLILNEYEGVE